MKREILSHCFSSWPRQEDATGSIKEVETPEVRDKYGTQGNIAYMETFSDNCTT